jgi:hypothetical protein
MSGSHRSINVSCCKEFEPLVFAGCAIMNRIYGAVHKTASALSGQLALSFFMPFCLTALAIIARIQVRCLQLPADPLPSINERATLHST